VKPRHELTTAEVGELHASLEHQLARIGVDSRPEVALRMLDLLNDPGSCLHDFARVVRADHAVSGRVLRLANSAFFGQRTPVTSLDRACLVLGLERLKSIALGFHLSRAAAGGDQQALGRAVWGQSVLRGCLAAALARVSAPALAAEAFVVGLMLDAGIPLMFRLVGEPFAALWKAGLTPGALHRRETEMLGFTHIDVVGALARRWRLPDLLALPIERHHVRPPDPVRDARPADRPTDRKEEGVQRLHRIAYVVGMLDLGPAAGAPALTMDTPGVSTATRVLGIGEPEMAAAVRKSGEEYAATLELFAEIASGLGPIDEVMERVQLDMVRAVDMQLEASLRAETEAVPARMVIGGQSIEIVREAQGPIAYLYDSHGQRLLTHRFSTGTLDAPALAEAFGLDLVDPLDADRVAAYVRGLAA